MTGVQKPAHRTRSRVVARHAGGRFYRRELPSSTAAVRTPPGSRPMKTGAYESLRSLQLWKAPVRQTPWRREPDSNHRSRSCERSLGCCRRGRRTDELDGAIKHRSSRETTMVGRGASRDGRLFLGGTDGSNPVPSSGESCKLYFASPDFVSPGLATGRCGPGRLERYAAGAGAEPPRRAYTDWPRHVMRER